MVWCAVRCAADPLRDHWLGVEKLKNLNKKIAAVLEEQGYTVLSIEKQRGQHIAELETDSPAGEDVIVDVWFDGTNKGFISAFYQYAIDFDADEHAEMWVDSRGKNGVPSSIRALIDDADAIEQHLMETAAKLDAIKL